MWRRVFSVNIVLDDKKILLPNLYNLSNMNSIQQSYYVVNKQNTARELSIENTDYLYMKMNKRKGGICLYR
jgi:hypothetical protein